MSAGAFADISKGVLPTISLSGAFKFLLDFFFRSLSKIFLRLFLEIIPQSLAKIVPGFWFFSKIFLKVAPEDHAMIIYEFF